MTPYLDKFPDRPTINELDLPPTFSQINQAVQSLKDNKSPDPNNIPPSRNIKEWRIYSCASSLFINIFYKFGTRKVCRPQLWKDDNIVTIYKTKGDSRGSAGCHRKGFDKGDAWWTAGT
ncbi:hypothetical protein Pmani_026913 [Petrolisthes manimaculis]|uniref:Uncharacterized protein n=1 Tax=Petrolisthes manimaculis TaxID=1843537 RepID=A0AAE1P2N7_9EUCA|nr:hypothetical protein Pmani_026913 [Petrolisthes manimaculis]